MSKKPKSLKTLNLRLPEAEHRTLTAFAEKSGRTITDIIREFIRSLKGTQS